MLLKVLLVVRQFNVGREMKVLLIIGNLHSIQLLTLKYSETFSNVYRGLGGLFPFAIHMWFN